MKKFLSAILILLLLIINNGCKKNDDSQNTKNTEEPKPTPVGTPTGEKASKLISTSGGNITSSDGTLEIDFPSGALSSDQTISIQPITNNCPGGNGPAYRLEPDGIKFNKPVTLKFHYADSVLESTLAKLMLLAYQDKSGIWFALGNGKNDTINHVLSGTTLHFTDYTYLDEVYLKPESATLKAGGHLQLYILITASQETIDGFGNKGYALLRGTSSSWAVNGVTNGNDQYGKISPINTNPQLYDYVTYTAPDQAPPQDKNPVLVSAEFNQNFAVPDGSGSYMLSKKVILYSHILIVDGGYHVELSFEADSVNEMGALWSLKDKGSFDVVFSGSNGSVTNINNSDITIGLQSNQGNCDVSINKAGVGPINIVDSSYVQALPGSSDPTITMVLVGFNSLDQKNWVESPSWNYSCPGGDNGQLGGGLGPPFPSVIQFNKTDSTQTFDVGGQYKIIVTPIK